MAVYYERKNAVAILTIDRPERRIEGKNNPSHSHLLKSKAAPGRAIPSAWPQQVA